MRARRPQGARRRAFVATLLAAMTGAVLLPGQVTSGAVFTRAGSVGDNTLTTGTVDPPTGLALTKDTVSRDPSISLSWTAPSTSQIEGYRVYRAASQAGPWTEVGWQTGRTSTAWVDPAPLPGNNTYGVRAVFNNWIDTSSQQATPDTTIGSNTGALNLTRQPRIAVVADGLNRMAGYLDGLGFTDVTLLLGATTYADVSGYDVVVADSPFWSITGTTATLVEDAFAAGKLVFTDGNDSTSEIDIISTFDATSDSRGPWGYNDLSASAAPSFPHFAQGVDGGPDPSTSIQSVAPGAVPVSDWTYANGTHAITAVAWTNGTGGRWFHMYFLSNSGPGASVGRAGLIWLLRS